MPNSSQNPFRQMSVLSRFGWLALLALAASPGCKRKDEPKTEESKTGAALTAAAASTGGVASALTARAPGDPKHPQLRPLPGGSVAVLEGVRPPMFQVPVGPRLGILRGKGVGAIRFGANVDTVQRLMEAKCSARNLKRCTYWAEAIEFFFDKQGLVEKIYIHGDERPIPDNSGKTFGVFNGRFPGTVSLGMYPKFVIEELGEPERVEKVAEADSRYPTVERHIYSDMELEYDKLANGNVVLAGILLKRPAPAAAGEADRPPAPKKP